MVVPVLSRNLSYLYTSVITVFWPIRPEELVVRLKISVPLMFFKLTVAPSMAAFAESTTFKSKVNALSIAPLLVDAPLNSIPGLRGVGNKFVPKVELIKVVVAE